MLDCPIALLTLSGSQARPDSQRIKDRLIGVGHWPGSKGRMQTGRFTRLTCSGLLVDTRDGHMSVQVMYHNPQPRTSAAPVQCVRRLRGLRSYEIDADAHTFTFHVEGALVRTLPGKQLTRVFAFSGKQLIVKSANANEHGRVAWDRY